MFALSRVRPVRSALAAGVIGAVALAGCATTGEGGGRATGPAARSTTAPSPGGWNRFSRALVVSNAMFPLRPGTEFIYRGTVMAGGRAAPHSVRFTVTDLTKVVDGVRTVVAWDRDFTGGKLGEQELAFFAQDDRGNVWNFGEYPEEYSAAGRFTGAPDTWIRGTAGAYGGLHMLARPTAGSAYREGLVPRIEFNDMSKVTATGRKARVPAGRYGGVLRVREWSPNDPGGGVQIKYYAPGVGLVQVGARGGDSQEFLTLTAIRHLGRADMAAVRTAARAMERRAYHISKVYRATAAAVRR
jgi:hypothetical protein